MTNCVTEQFFFFFFNLIKKNMKKTCKLSVYYVLLHTYYDVESKKSLDALQHTRKAYKALI